MTVAALRFREAVEADIPAMLAIRLAVRENRLPDPSWLTQQMWLDSLRDAGKANCHVCELDSQVIGFSIGRLAEADIWALFVAPDREGLGAGKQLLRLIADWMFACGVTEIQLGTGVDTRADAFYSRQGWRRDAALSAKGERVYRLARPTMADARSDAEASA